MRKLKDRSRIKVWHQSPGRDRFLYGTLVTLRGIYAESESLRDKYRTYDAYEAEQRRRGQDFPIWGRKDTTVVTGDPLRTAKLRELRAQCVELKPGEEIEVDGKVWVVSVSGDYSDFVHCYPKIEAAATA